MPIRPSSAHVIRMASAFLAATVTIGLTQGVAAASDENLDTLREIHQAVTSEATELQAAPLSLKVPAEGGGPLPLESGIGTAPEVNLHLPAEGGPSTSGSTTLYEATGTGEAQIAVQPVPGGIRALINIDSADAPERYEFRLSGDIARLVHNPDGSVAAFDRTNTLVGGFAKPWARDATGREVRTRYETRRTTLVQIVEHQGRGYRYGVTADPLWLGVAIRACIAVRCYSWWPKHLAREFQHGHITPAVKSLLWGWFCKKSFIC